MGGNGAEVSRLLDGGVRTARRIMVGLVGVTVILVGVALLVLPGPAFLVIPVGVGILALEFEWARRWMKRLREAVPMGSATDPPSDSNRRSDAASEVEID